MATALASLMALPVAALPVQVTPVERLTRLEAALGPECPRLFIKRDDTLSFARGGNKVRKMQLVAAEASAAGADTLITCGAIQSNHARVAAATGAVLGWRVILVLSGELPPRATGNLRLDHLFGAEVRCVPAPGDREPAMEAAAEEVRAGGHRPFVVPLGASTPIGAAAIARAVAEVGAAGVRPDVIVHASSSGGTQAGLMAGCALFGARAEVVGISADEPAPVLSARVVALLEGLAARLGARSETVGLDRDVRIDDSQVGAGYAAPTDAAAEATELVARREGIVLDPVYTAKAMAGLIAGVRAGRFGGSDRTVLFWHTGGLHESW